MVVTGTYNPHLVALSILVAAFASYTALDLGGRVAATRGVAPRMWLVPAAMAMGGGIWSMHFIAMLAFNMPTPMSYDLGLTVLSLVVAILVTGAGFYFINRQSALPLSFVFSGIFMGLGISAMHYIGMAAMRQHAQISYDFLFVTLSLVIAIGASTTALWLAFRTTDLGQKLVAAVVMGLAISGMHYSAMRGTTFAVHSPVHEAQGYASLDQTNLALVVAGITFVILAFALIASLQQENSERQRAEERLRRSEDYLSEGQRLSHTGSFGWDPSSGKTYWTEEAFRIFGYDPATTPTLELLQLRIHPDDVAAFRQVVERASHDGQDFAHEYRLRMPDESVKHIHIVARAFRDEAGDVDFVGAVMDVTAIRLAQRELHKTQTDLAHVVRVTSLGELTASIAHEVNQPLGGVIMNAEACLSWLDREQPNLTEAHAALERIVRDGTRAGEVIRRIRALAKKADMKMEPLNLNEVLSEALTFVQHELLNSRVALRVEYASALPVILADKVQLQQVILNLVINGIEAMQPITDRARELVIRSEQDDAHQVRVTVTDCGVGFSPDSTDRLFNTFFTTKSSGMGMGLSICRSIIEHHGGRIWAVPDVARGATIQFTLPFIQGQHSANYGSNFTGDASPRKRVARDPSVSTD
jgi:NO-binding membrane sensor protein with MHYT domain/nitrogen-specific signal transduction histidine kinase